MECRNLLKIYFGLFTCLKAVFGAGMENIYISGCNNEVMQVHCPENHKIAIKRAHYGVKANPQCKVRGYERSRACCERAQEDCIIQDNSIYTTLNIKCSGFQSCYPKVNKIRTRGNCKDPQMKATDFMTVVYDCVPDSDIAQFCTNDVKQGKTLYLSNQNYPDPISSGNHYCQCLIKSRFSPGLSINVVDIMITMPEYKNICPQELRIVDAYKSDRVSCGRSGMYGFRNIYDRMVSNVTMILESKVSERRGYIWTQLRANSPDDYVTIYCGEAMDQLLYGNVTKARTTEGPDLANSTALYGVSSETKIIPDMIIIIGTVAGAVALILIFCIVAIAVHCTRESERQAMPKIPEVIPSPMVRGKIYHPDELDATHHRYNYDEDRYCSIKRSPMKLTKFSDLDNDADLKLKEAFLQGSDTDPTPMNHVNRVNHINHVNPVNHVHVQPNGFPPNLVESPESPLLLEPPATYASYDSTEKAAEKYFTMNPQKPQSEVAEIRITSSLPQRGQKNKKAKTVTFSPVAMVTPLPSGSEESIGSEGDRNLANIIDTYQGLSSPDFEKNRKPLILPPPNETGGFVSIQGPNDEEIAEMEELWKSLADTTTMDDGAYDNIDYLLAQNRAKYETEA